MKPTDTPRRDVPPQEAGGPTPGYRQKARATRRKKWLAGALVLLGAAGLVVAAVLFFSRWQVYRQAQNEYDDLRRRYGVSAQAAPQEGPGAEHKVTVPTLQLLNEDCVAWIEIPGTEVEYPVLQAADNDYYLRRTFEKTPNIAGSIFVDYRCRPDFTDRHSLVYGHNMLDGSMFSSLKSYLRPAWLKEHQLIWLHLPDELLCYRVVAARQLGAEDALYSALPGSGQSGGALDALLEEAGQDPADVARYLTLSTCADDDDGQRYVVVARLEEAPAE